MTEVEKEAIENLRNIIANPDTKFWIGKNGIESIASVLNLIEKQDIQIEADRMTIAKLRFETEEATNRLLTNDEELKLIFEEGKKEGRRNIVIEIRKLIEEELPDDELMETCQNVDTNGVEVRKKLEKIIEKPEEKK